MVMFTPEANSAPLQALVAIFDAILGTVCAYYPPVAGQNEIVRTRRPIVNISPHNGQVDIPYGITNIETNFKNYPGTIVTTTTTQDGENRQTH